VYDSTSKDERAMTEYERSRAMPALPEHVFDQAANFDQLESWLPDELHVHREDPPAVTVHEDRTDQDTPALLRPRPERMRLEWGTRQDSGYTGYLQVAGADNGTSEVTVHLSFPDDEHDPGEQAVREALDRSLERLEEQVRMRIENAGG
jgi:hypothetical protein